MSIRETVSKTFAFVRDRKKAYQLLFDSSKPPARIVLADLSKFCRAHETCVVPGDRDRTLLLEGRREVFLRITQHLHIPEQELYDLYTNHPLISKHDED